MFRLLGLPRGTTLERLTFNDLLGVANTIIEKALELKVYKHTLSMQIHIYTVGTESIQTPLNFSPFVLLQPFAKIKKVHFISH